MSASDGMSNGMIADRLDELFATVTTQGRQYSLCEVADGINARAGRNVMTCQDLALLLRGADTHPTLGQLRVIADWFGVNVGYFMDSVLPNTTPEERQFLDLMCDSEVRRVVDMVQDLSSESLDLVDRVLDVLSKPESLPPGAEASEGKPAGRSGATFGPEA